MSEEPLFRCRRSAGRMVYGAIRAEVVGGDDCSVRPFAAMLQVYVLG